MPMQIARRRPRHCRNRSSGSGPLAMKGHGHGHRRPIALYQLPAQHHQHQHSTPWRQHSSSGAWTATQHFFPSRNPRMRTTFVLAAVCLLATACLCAAGKPKAPVITKATFEFRTDAMGNLEDYQIAFNGKTGELYVHSVQVEDPDTEMFMWRNTNTDNCYTGLKKNGQFMCQKESTCGGQTWPQLIPPTAEFERYDKCLKGSLAEGSTCYVFKDAEMGEVYVKRSRSVVVSGLSSIAMENVFGTSDLVIPLTKFSTSASFPAVPDACQQHGFVGGQ